MAMNRWGNDDYAKQLEVEYVYKNVGKRQLVVDRKEIKEISNMIDDISKLVEKIEIKSSIINDILNGIEYDNR
jgi:hypothetical protein